MEEKKPSNGVSPVEADSADASEVGPSRRELLVKGGKVVAGIGVAALLGNLGNWALSYAADKEPIKIGILHSLSGTMAISEVSLRDTVMMAVEEINAKGGVMGRMIKPVVVDPASNWDLFAEKAKQLLLQDKVAVVLAVGLRSAASRCCRCSRRITAYSSTPCSTREKSVRATSSTPAPLRISRLCRRSII